MEKFEYQEKDGKVFCPLANKWLVAKPEEKVRQKYICILVNDYGYSLDQMAQEQKVNNTYASYLIRYRFDISIVLPEYVNILFMTQLVREQIAVMRRQGGGQYNLNSDEIGAIRIPVPSIPEQQAIVAAYDSAKDGANIYYDKGQTLKEKAAADFEKCIFA